MERHYKGTIYYSAQFSKEVTVKKYVFDSNALILIYEKNVEIIPYHTFKNAVFEKLEKKNIINEGENKKCL